MRKNRRVTTLNLRPVPHGYTVTVLRTTDDGEHQHAYWIMRTDYPSAGPYRSTATSCRWR